MDAASQRPGEPNGVDGVEEIEFEALEEKVDAQSAPDSAERVARRGTAASQGAAESSCAAEPAAPATVLLAFCNVLGGFLYGYNLGLVPMFLYFVNHFVECAQYSGAGGCSSAPHGSCSWQNATCVTATCNVTNVSSAANCPSTINTWSSSQIGLFAAASAVGGFVGAPLAHFLLPTIGKPNTMMVAALAVLVLPALTSIGYSVNSFALIIVAQFLIGIPTLFCCVACPLYVRENARPDVSRQLGTLFQVTVAASVMLAALWGLTVEPRDLHEHFSIEWRVHYLVQFQVIPALMLLIVSRLLPPEPGQGSVNSSLSSAENADARGARFTWVMVASAVLLASTNQSAIGAFVAYLPQIMKQAGLAALLGNFLGQGWAFLSSLIAIPLSTRVRPLGLYVGCVLIGGVACTVCAMALHPKVMTDEHGRLGLGMTCVFVFLSSFQIGTGPMFWTLASEIFPHRFRREGATICNMLIYGFTALVNYFFPIGVISLSGGESENQNVGLAFIFIIFGGFAVVASLALLLLNYKNTAQTAHTCHD